MEHRPHIVVVEDEVTQRHLLVDYLARQNFRVSGVNGGAALRKLVERDRPALVLLESKPAPCTRGKSRVFGEQQETSFSGGLRGGGCSLDRTSLHRQIPC